METSVIVERLRGWGCDVDGAVSRCAEDEEFFISLLNRYADTAEFLQLRGLIAERRTQEAFTLAHKLKGKLLNLGLTPLCESIIPITESLRGGCCEGLEPLFDRLLSDKAVLDGMMASSGINI